MKRIERSGSARPVTLKTLETLKTHETSIKSFTIELETRKSSKSVRGMPRLSEARKDVTSCDKLGVGANGP